jgi:D-alanyl-D-alanine carboxypeptidase
MRSRSFFVILSLALFAFVALATSPEVHAKSSATKKVSASSSPKKATASKKSSAKSKSTASKKHYRKVYGAHQSTNNENKFAAVVVDASTGQVLYEKNAGEMRYPASLTKMMTLYLTFEQLKKKRLSLYQNMQVSERAAGQPETNINLTGSSRLSVEEAIEALVVRSANDAALVLAEHIGGTQWNFAQMMTQKARELGMRDTVFRNPHGLPDSGQYTNAYDMARLGIALRRDFPEYYKYFKTGRFEYGGVTYTTHNRVMLRYGGADGIKTGYIRASGFNLVTSVKKDGYNIVAVIMGGTSGTARDDQMISMLDRTFAELESKNRNHLAQSMNVTPLAANTF